MSTFPRTLTLACIALTTTAASPAATATEPQVHVSAEAFEPTTWTYTTDPANPGWAYCCNAEDDASWIRLDLGAFGLVSVPADPEARPEARPVFVVDPRAPGYAYSGNVEAESNWVRLDGWEGLLDSLQRSSAPVEAPPLTPQAALAFPTAATRPQPTSVPNAAAPLTQWPPPGTYELGPRDQVGISAGCCQVLGMFMPLTFPENWRGRMMQITIEKVQYQKWSNGSYLPATETDRWEGSIYWAPYPMRAGDQYIGPGGTCGYGARPADVCWLDGWDPSTVARWRVEPGRYFLFFRDHDTRYNDQQVLNVRFRLNFSS